MFSPGIWWSWIEGESFRLFCPGFADELVGREAFEGLEPPGEVVGGDEVCEVAAELVVAVVVEALDRRVLDRPVHALDLAVRPRMPGLGQAMVDVVIGAGVFEGMGTRTARCARSSALISGGRPGVAGRDR